MIDANNNNDTHAVLSLVFGILSVVGVASIGLGISAIILGVKQNKQEKNSLAKAGIILGAVGIGLRILSILAIVAIYGLYFLIILGIFTGAGMA